MMKVFAVCLALTATVAFAAGPNDLELWFSTTGALSGQAPANPVLPSGYTGKVFLWARTTGAFTPVSTTYDVNGVPTAWNYNTWVGACYQGISLDSNTTIGFNSAASGSGMFNTAIGTSLRWQPEGDFTWANGDQFNIAGVGASYRGAGALLDPAQGVGGNASNDANQYVSAGKLYTKLGYVTISSAPAGASFFMTIGTGTIARRNGDPTNDLTFLGAGDDGIHGPIVGATSALADMTVAPEPASLLLLGLAGLALRRR